MCFLYFDREAIRGFPKSKFTEIQWIQRIHGIWSDAWIGADIRILSVICILLVVWSLCWSLTQEVVVVLLQKIVNEFVELGEQI